MVKKSETFCPFHGACHTTKDSFYVNQACSTPQGSPIKCRCLCDNNGNSLSEGFSPLAVEVYSPFESTNPYSILSHCDDGIEIEYQSGALVSRHGFSEFIDDIPMDTMNELSTLVLSVDHAGFPTSTVLHYCETLLLLIADIRKSSDSEDVIRAILHFIKHIYGSRSVTLSLYKAFIEAKIMRIWRSFRPQSDFGEYAACADFIADIGESELVRRLRDTMSYLVCFSVFEKFNYDFTSKDGKFEDYSRYLANNAPLFTANMFVSVLQTLKLALENGKKFLMTGCVGDIFYSENSVSRFNEMYSQIMLDGRVLSNPEPFGVSAATYEYDLTQAIEDGQHLLKSKAFLSRFDLNIIQKRVHELNGLKRDFELAKLAQGTREPPFSILIHGESGIGKSSFISILFCHYAKLSQRWGENLKCDDEFMYTRCAADEYWSQFRSWQWCILLDDIAVRLASKATEDETLDEIIRINNDVTWIPPQAELEQKGRNPVKPKLFIGSTNVKNMNASSWFEVPFATQRRFPYVITLKPKEEYATIAPNGSLMLDREKARLAQEVGYDDFWHICVERVVPGLNAGNQKHRIMAAYDVVLDTDDIDEFLLWYRDAIEAHNAQNKRMMDATSKYKSVVLCDICSLQMHKCECAQPQSFMSKSTEIFSVLWILQTLYSLCVVMSLSDYHCVQCVGNWGRSCIISFTNRILVRNAQKFWHRLQNPLIIKTSLALITACIAFFTFSAYKKGTRGDNPDSSKPTNSDKLSVEGNIPSGRKPEPRDERENIWEWREPPAITSFDLTPQMTSLSALPVSKQLARLHNNMFNFVIYSSDGRSGSGKCLAIGGQLYITNAHFFKNNIVRMHLSRENEKSSVGLRRTFNIYEGVNLFLDEESDLAMFSVVDLPPNKCIRQLFFEKRVALPECNGIWMNRTTDGKIHSQKLFCLTLTRSRMLDREKNIDSMHDVYMCRTSATTQEGDCGSVALGVLSSKYLSILGIHVGSIRSDPLRIMILEVTRDKLSKLEEKFDSLCKVEQGHMDLTDGYGGVRNITTLHEKSPFNYLPQGGDATVYGSIEATFNPKSCVGPTLFSHQFCEATIEDGPLRIVDVMDKPVMKGYIPKHLSLQHMIRTNEQTDHAALFLCEQAFLADIHSHIPDSEYDLVHVLDLDTAINGVAGIAYLDAMKRSTSAGEPWREVKRAHMIEREDGTVDITPEMKERVREIESNYLSNKQRHPMFAATFKDEPTHQDKIASQKTRVFCAAPMDWSIVVRKYYLPIIRVMQRNPFVFETAVGVQAQTYQWEKFYHHIIKYGSDRIIAGDYSKYDKKMCPAFILAAFRILMSIAQKANVGEEAIQIMRGIALDVAFPTVNFFGDIVTFHGTNPSGHPLTVIINSLVNSLYMRYAYYKLNPLGDIGTFKSHVSLVTYGDDNIMSVSPDIDWFNHSLVQEALKTIGVDYTMANKDQETCPFIHISEASFLKRVFRYDEDIGAIVGRLDHSSISKMLTKCVKTRNYIPEQHMLSVIKAALEEYFWYGKQIFVDRRNKFMSIARITGLLQYADNINAFPLWDELKDRYDEASLPHR